LSGSAPTAAATTIQAAAASRPTAAVADHTPTTVAAANPAFAVDALARGDYASALKAYRALAHDHPDDHSYAFIAATLHHQLARTCAEHSALGEQPCTVP
jgi:Tfp pilus assembly protein PilF